MPKEFAVKFRVYGEQVSGFETSEGFEFFEVEEAAHWEAAGKAFVLLGFGWGGLVAFFASDCCAVLEDPIEPPFLG